MPAIVAFGIIFGIIILVIVANIKVVPQANAFVIERFGAYYATWHTGIHVKVPFMDRIAKRISLKEQVVDFEPQSVITRDNVSMQIDTVVYFQVTDSKLYTYGVEHPIMAIETLCATTLRNIIGELELAYRLTPARFVAITGTNGKTTTTTLVGEIFREDGRKTAVVGNIGEPVVTEAVKADEDEWLITEVSSFQLETTREFRPLISAILNLTPDHLNRHKTMEAYGNAKARVAVMQSEDEFLVINGDDPAAMALASQSKAKVKRRYLCQRY